LEEGVKGERRCGGDREGEEEQKDEKRARRG
jgi:hypothetical protein